MKAQTPAEGISVNTTNGSQGYHIECICTCEDHAIDVYIDVSHEPGFDEVEIGFYMKMWYPPFRGMWHRIKTAASVLFTGYATKEHSILLTSQAATNFTSAVENTIAKIETQIANDKSAKK